jgi:ABC-type Fe3+-siderophore transport system permease subunit
LAAALAQEPEVLLLDEPTAALDLRFQVEIYETLRRLNRERNLTVVAVTHDLNLAARFCPRLVLLAQGRIVADGGAAEILRAELIARHYGVDVEVGMRADGVTPFLLPGVRRIADERPHARPLRYDARAFRLVLRRRRAAVPADRLGGHRPRAALAHRHEPSASLDASVLFLTRLPRLLLAALAGAALALAGAAFQALLRNPLAEPFTWAFPAAARWARCWRSSWGWTWRCSASRR